MGLLPVRLFQQCKATTVYHSHTLSQLHRLTPSIGSTEKLSGQSCEHIKIHLSTDCHHPPKSTIYWVQDMQVCMAITFMQLCMSLRVNNGLDIAIIMLMK